ncbi:GNAT family N-acetyltransferase [Curtobacterium sp. MCBA15_001]|uniref:GNAT family N-acetyltransferase n=1 Tax=Curtobacterium sp. MCBA15_001 TaxID=1898731 RepID=UPI0008DD33B7|nr:GNAT family N-acetyltransferase [Curtobacterium sp. MCBA15_001]OIH94498.1 hypothetical protein BIU90_05110 [Curtobacterium sp. MCBA15_001]
MTLQPVRPGTPTAESVVRRYLAEVASRWYGRPATRSEIDQTILDEPYDDLCGDTGVFVVATDDGAPVACAGARFLDGTAELTKVFTEPSRRGQGLGGRMLRAVEDHCRAAGMTAVRLDTRAELSEACALYERNGYVQVEPFNDDPYSDRWYAKSLRR